MGKVKMSQLPVVASKNGLKVLVVDTNNKNKVFDITNLLLSSEFQQALSEHNTSATAHEDLRELVEGRYNALTFLDEAQLVSWINGTYTRDDEVLVGDLVKGQNIYLMSKDEPDYWVSSLPVVGSTMETMSGLNELPTDKIDLSEYQLLLSGSTDGNILVDQTTKRVSLAQVLRNITSIQGVTGAPAIKIITTADGKQAVAEGNGTTASGNYSHAEGDSTQATGDMSHTQGTGTQANRKSQTAIGEYNLADAAGATTRGNYVEIVGNGTDDSNRSNARTLDWNGNEVLAGTITANGVNLNAALNSKQDALGFTPENVANKKTSLAENSDTYYPTQKAVRTAVDAKVTGAVSSVANEVPVYNGTTGKALKSGSGVIAVAGNLTATNDMASATKTIGGKVRMEYDTATDTLEFNFL